MFFETLRGVKVKYLLAFACWSFGSFFLALSIVYRLRLEDMTPSYLAEFESNSALRLRSYAWVAGFKTANFAVAVLLMVAGLWRIMH